MSGDFTVTLLWEVHLFFLPSGWRSAINETACCITYSLPGFNDAWTTRANSEYAAQLIRYRRSAQEQSWVSEQVRWRRRKKSERCVHLAPLSSGWNYPVTPFLPPQPLHLDLLLHLLSGHKHRSETWEWKLVFKTVENIRLFANWIQQPASLNLIIFPQLTAKFHNRRLVRPTEK